MSAIVVLHADAELLAAVKPSGLPTVPARGEALDLCLHHQLEAQLGERLWVVHRLDRDASGVVVFARSAQAHRELCLAFEHRQVGKSYAAFVAGELTPPAGRIDLALHDARRGKSRPAQPGEPGRREASTDYSTRQRWAREGRVISLIEARPLTGRHHQIRVHLRARGVPILFDPLYGGAVASLPGAPSARLALHAERLVLRQGALELVAPLPEDLAALRAWLDEGR